jgi:ubiquinol-cytochrome c reductase iron-sulfur subunit
VDRDPGVGERPASAAAAFAFICSTLAAVGLAVVYGRGGQPQAEGALLAVSLGGLGVGAVLWGERFLPQATVEEERHQLVMPEDEEAAARDFERGEEYIHRRRFLARLMTAAAGALGVAALFPIRSLGPSPGRALDETDWKPGLPLVGDDGRPIKATDLEVGGVLTAYPPGYTGAGDTPVVVIRLDPSDITELPGRESWSPQGYIAYSKICTHAGCPVGLYQRQNRRLLCPCHQSAFDVVNGARPLFGPATRALPQLPIQIDPDGTIRAQSDFTEPVGPGFWNHP